MIEYGGQFIGDIRRIQNIESISTEAIHIRPADESSGTIESVPVEATPVDSSNENRCTSAEELASYASDLYPPPTNFDSSGKSLALRMWLAVECKKRVVQNKSNHSDRLICKTFNVTRSTFNRHYHDKGGPSAHGYYTIGQFNKRARI